MEPVPGNEHGEDQNQLSTAARKAVIAGVGGAVTAAGVVMLVTPGPGILVSLAGLGILAREFPFAEAQLDRIRRRLGRSRDRAS